jgi:hypothetical protein
MRANVVNSAMQTYAVSRGSRARKTASRSIQSWREYTHALTGISH